MANALERRLTLRVLKDEMAYAEFERAMKDPEQFKLDEAGMKHERWRVTGKVKTARRGYQWAWYIHRTANGYFIGWRETYNPTTGKIERDQYTARRTKNRLQALQRKRYQDALAKGATSYKWNAPWGTILPTKPTRDPRAGLEKRWENLLAKAVKKEQRICFGIAWFRTEAEANKLGELNQRLGVRYEGGWFDGMPCKRDPSFDKKRPKLYACTY